MAKVKKQKSKEKKHLLLLFLLTLCFLLSTVVKSPAANLVSQAGLPSLQAHPLPPRLAQWQDNTNSGDYFSQVIPTNVGYLVWSEFPVKVYLDEPKEPVGTSAAEQRFQQWVNAVLQALQQWNVYLPLAVVEEREKADISILRDSPPLRPSFNRDTGELQLPPARTAETSYEVYLRQQAGTTPMLDHKCTILLSPDLSATHTLATARHELGHALGIWGHSHLQTDVMYFSQVRNPPLISQRDINTLKRVYEQPTRLGWLVSSY